MLIVSRWVRRNVWAIIAIVLVSVFTRRAVDWLRMPNRLDPISAQAMDMSDVRLPVGAAPVELVRIKRLGAANADMILAPPQALVDEDGFTCIWIARPLVGRAGLTAVSVPVKRWNGSDGAVTLGGRVNAVDSIIVRGPENLRSGDAIVAAKWMPDGSVLLPMASDVSEGPRYRCPVCGMVYSAAAAARNSYRDPMDGASLVPED